MEVLKLHSEGMIALTACLHGQIPWLIGQRDMAGAKIKAQELFDIFGDRLYFEIQENGLTEQQKVNDGLKILGAKWASSWWRPTIVTTSIAKRRMPTNCCSASRPARPSTTQNRFKFSTDEFYFKSPENMKRSFAHCPEAIATTLEIAERCNLEIEFGDYYFPNFPVPEGETLESMFTKACREGLKDRFARCARPAPSPPKWKRPTANG